MRSTTALYAALMVASQSGHGLEISLCNGDGERPVQVKGVSGTFCVRQQLCEGFYSSASSQLLACPRAGQQDVVMNVVLDRDSCCAVVDSGSGELGCIQKDDFQQTACLLWSRDQDSAHMTRRRRRRSNLRNFVASEVSSTNSVAQPIPTKSPVAINLAPELTTAAPTVEPIVTTLASTKAPVLGSQVPVTIIEGHVTTLLHPEASHIKVSPSTQIASVEIPQAPAQMPEASPPTIEDPVQTTSVPFATVDSQEIQASVPIPVCKTERPALAPTPNVSETLIQTSASTWPNSPSMVASVAPLDTTSSLIATQDSISATATHNGTSTSTMATEIPVVDDELLTTAARPSLMAPNITEIAPQPTEATTMVMPNLSSGTSATNPTIDSSASATVTLTSSPPAASDAPVTSTMSAIGSPTSAGQLPMTETVNENVYTPGTATGISRYPTAFSSIILPTTTTVIPRITDSVSNTSIVNETTSPSIVMPAQSDPTVSATSTSLAGLSNLTLDPTSSPSIAAIPVLNSDPSIEAIRPTSIITPTSTAAQLFAPAMPPSAVGPDSGFAPNSTDESPSGCFLGAPNCSFGTTTSEPTEPLLTSRPPLSETSPTRARHAGVNTPHPSFSSNDSIASNDDLQLSPIIDDDGGNSNAPSANIRSTGGSSMGNTVTYVVVGCAAIIAILIGIFYLRPKRVNPINQLTPLELPPPTNRSGNGECWYDRTLESDSVGVYNASSTPRH